MTKRIPNLWKMKLKADDRDPGTLYSLYLCNLMLKEQYQRVVEVCPIIRRHASLGPGSKEGLFTFSMEREALLLRGNVKVALKRARLRDRIRYGKPVNYTHHQWDESDPIEGYWLIYTLAPLHYYNGLYQLGCQLMETGLGIWFKQSNRVSFEWLYNIIPRRETPGYLQHATLAMFYRKLGKDLREWKHWNNFAEGFPEKLYRAVGITKAELRDDPRQLRKMMAKIRKIEHTYRPYCTSDCSFGIDDIINTPKQIHRAHERRRRETERQQLLRQDSSRQIDQRLEELFPELRIK